MLILVVSIAFAGEIYDQKLTKSRANRGYDAHGTAIYSYIEVDEYSDELDPEEELGAFEVEAGVREVHSVVIINGDVNSELDDLRIGTVRAGRGGSLREVNSRVNIDGGVDSTGGGSVNIGVVNLNNRPRRQIRVENRVDIDGSFESK